MSMNGFSGDVKYVNTGTLSGMKRQEAAALDAVARHFSGTWEPGRTAHHCVTLKPSPASGRAAGKLRLRFDKVVRSVMGRLESGLADAVPDGSILLVTITAPIRQDSKTAAAIVEQVGARLAGRWKGGAERATIHGNRVQWTLVRSATSGAPKLIAFVHNSDDDPPVLFHLTRQFVELRRAAQPAAGGWLVIATSEAHSCLDACRYIESRVRLSAGFDKAVVVFGDGRVGVVAEEVHPVPNHAGAGKSRTKPVKTVANPSKD